MTAFALRRRLGAEALGAALLLAIVVGSGIMGDRLSGGVAGLALLANTLATAAGLAVLIAVFGPISGAHFNPVVTLAAVASRQMSWTTGLAYLAAQTAGAIAGVLVAHAMFGLPLLQVSATVRAGPAQALSEAVATFGLLLTIRGAARFRPAFAPAAVGLYIAAAYWFTASTAFANPAVTLARCLTDTFSGIAPASAPVFIAAQLAGGLAAVVAFNWLSLETPPHERT